MTAIGFVGLGAMGGRIAGRLLTAGNVVYGTNRTKSKADSLLERGLIWRDSPRVALPSTAVASDLLSAAQELGYGDRDIVVLFDIVAQLAGRDNVAA